MTTISRLEQATKAFDAVVPVKEKTNESSELRYCTKAILSFRGALIKILDVTPKNGKGYEDLATGLSKKLALCDKQVHDLKTHYIPSEREAIIGAIAESSLPIARNPSPDATLGVVLFGSCPS